jgi:hypothetical protein
VREGSDRTALDPARSLREEGEEPFHGDIRMRLCISLIAALGLVACGQNPAPPAETAEAPAAAGTDHSGHDMGAMTAEMAASDAADDVAGAGETPDNHTFHTYPAKIEVVRLPAGDGVWSAHGYAESELFVLKDTAEETLPDGKKVQVVRFETKASGNGKVVFERRATDNPADPVLEARTVNFMIH